MMDKNTGTRTLLASTFLHLLQLKYNMLWGTNLHGNRMLVPQHINYSVTNSVAFKLVMLQILYTACWAFRSICYGTKISECSAVQAVCIRNTNSAPNTGNTQFAFCTLKKDTHTCDCKTWHSGLNRPCRLQWTAKFSSVILGKSATCLYVIHYRQEWEITLDAQIARHAGSFLGKHSLLYLFRVIWSSIRK